MALDYDQVVAIEAQLNRVKSVDPVHQPFVDLIRQLIDYAHLAHRDVQQARAISALDWGNRIGIETPGSHDIFRKEAMERIVSGLKMMAHMTIRPASSRPWKAALFLEELWDDYKKKYHRLPSWHNIPSEARIKISRLFNARAPEIGQVLYNNLQDVLINAVGGTVQSPSACMPRWDDLPNHTRDYLVQLLTDDGDIGAASNVYGRVARMVSPYIAQTFPTPQGAEDAGDQNEAAQTGGEVAEQMAGQSHDLGQETGGGV